jgi:hypothetical protein
LERFSGVFHQCVHPQVLSFAAAGGVVQEHIEKLLAALIILAFLVLLIAMTWPVSTGEPKKDSPAANSQTNTQTASSKKRGPSLKDRYDGSARSNKRSRRMAMRYDGDGACGSGWENDCYRRASPPPRYDNYGYEIRRKPCQDDEGPCYCEDSWRPYWAWPRRRCHY